MNISGAVQFTVHKSGPETNYTYTEDISLSYNEGELLNVQEQRSPQLGARRIKDSFCCGHIHDSEGDQCHGVLTKANPCFVIEANVLRSERVKCVDLHPSEPWYQAVVSNLEDAHEQKNGNCQLIALTVSSSSA